MRVVCNKIKTCPKYCGAKQPHDNSQCEPCPFHDNVKCVEVKTFLCYQGEEHEMESAK